MRIKSLDVLKAVAIIAVVLYHSGFMTFGYLGVDLFLVINGFLVTKGLDRKLLNSGALTLRGNLRDYVQFEISRIERLLPPLLVAGFVCMTVGFFVMIDDTYESLSQSVIATNLFGNNVVELISTGNYWAANKAYSPLMHTWYVGLLMQFYIVYPFLFFIAGLDRHNSRRTLLNILVIAGAISLFCFIGETNTARRFYLLPTRFFEFAVGSIVALTYRPQENKAFNKYFVFLCYIILLALLFVNIELFPSTVRLLTVVGLSCIMICSQDVLENRVTGNTIIAKIGSASYSIFIWHQIVFAFYRSLYGSSFGVVGYIFCLAVISFLSIASYLFIEQRSVELLKSNKGKKKFYLSYGIVFIALSVFAFTVYQKAGVVRDIPELDVSKSNPQRGMWAKFNSNNSIYDREFETSKRHWFVIGNSFGRDFVNIILLSSASDSVEVSYCEMKDYKRRKYEERFKAADKIFVSSKGFSEDSVHEIEILALATGHVLEDVIVVGDKYFGETMEQFYSKRYKDDYYNTTIQVPSDLLVKNEINKNNYGLRYIDLFGMSTDSDGKARVFTGNKKFISSDCIHLTRAGASFFAECINWPQYL